MSASGRRTFPAMSPIYGWRVTTSWVKAQIPFGSSRHSRHDRFDV